MLSGGNQGVPHREEGGHGHLPSEHWSCLRSNGEGLLNTWVRKREKDVESK